MEWFELTAVILGPGGAVYVGVRTALNGIKRDILDVKRDVRDLRDWHLKGKSSAVDSG